jgi:hypothetical protein
VQCSRRAEARDTKLSNSAAQTGLYKGVRIIWATEVDGAIEYLTGLIDQGLQLCPHNQPGL